MRALWIALAVILVDQVTKTIVVRSMYLGQSIPIIGDWFRFTFTTNPGMAFGITFGPAGLMPAMAIIATILIIVYMWKVRGAYAPYRWSLAFILSGALGNIIDRVFYGVIYENWDLFPGSGLFSGEVVDFIHFNIWYGRIDFPVLGLRSIALFPIWNVADMAIVCGVVGVILTQKKFHEWQLAQAVEAELATDPPLPANATAPQPENPIASDVPPTQA